MTTKGMLDTSVIIDAAKVNVSTLADELVISSITLAELAAGPLATRDVVEQAIRQERLQWSESTFDVVPFDSRAAHAYGRVYALIRKADRKPRARVADALIAATALAYEVPLFTRNVDDFKGLNKVLDIIAV